MLDNNVLIEKLNKVSAVFIEKNNEYEEGINSRKELLDKYNNYIFVDLPKFYSDRTFLSNPDSFNLLENICRDVNYNFNRDFWFRAFGQFLYKNRPDLMQIGVEGKYNPETREYKPWGIVGFIKKTKINVLKSEIYRITQDRNKYNESYVSFMDIVNSTLDSRKVSTPVESSYLFNQMIQSIVELEVEGLTLEDKTQIIEFLCVKNSELSYKKIMKKRARTANREILEEPALEEEITIEEPLEDNDSIQKFEEENAESIEKIKIEIQNIEQNYIDVKNINPELDKTVEDLTTIINENNNEDNTQLDLLSLNSRAGILKLNALIIEKELPLTPQIYIQTLFREKINLIYEDYTTSDNVNEKKELISEILQQIEYYKNIKTQEELVQIIEEEEIKRFEAENADIIAEANFVSSSLEEKLTPYLNSEEISNHLDSYNESMTATLSEERMLDIDKMNSKEGRDLILYYTKQANISADVVIGLHAIDDLNAYLKMYEDALTIEEKNAYLEEIKKIVNVGKSLQIPVVNYTDDLEKNSGNEINEVLLLSSGDGELFASRYLMKDRRNYSEKEKTAIISSLDNFKNSNMERISGKCKICKDSDIKPLNISEHEIKRKRTGNMRFVWMNINSLFKSHPEYKEYFSNTKFPCYVIMCIGYKKNGVDIYDEMKNPKVQNATVQFHDMLIDEFEKIKHDNSITNKEEAIINFVKELAAKNYEKFVQELNIRGNDDAEIEHDSSRGEL